MKALCAFLMMIGVGISMVAFLPRFDRACSVLDYGRATDLINGRASEWDDANTLANSTGRIALAGPVGQLQQIRRSTDALSVPWCAESSKRLLLKGMDHTINGYLCFMRDEYVCDAFFTAAQKVFADFKTEQRKL